MSKKKLEYLGIPKEIKLYDFTRIRIHDASV
jgi:hypothetical protein